MTLSISHREILTVLCCLLFAAFPSKAFDIQEAVTNPKFWPSDAESTYKYYNEDGLKWLSSDKTVLYSNNNKVIQFDRSNRWKIDELKITFRKNGRKTRVDTVDFLIQDGENLPELGNIILGIESLYSKPSSSRIDLKKYKPQLTVTDPFITLTRDLYFWKILDKKVQFLADVRNTGEGTARCYCCLEVVSREDKIRYYRIHFVAPHAYFNFLQDFRKAAEPPKQPSPKMFVRYVKSDKKSKEMTIQNVPMVIAGSGGARATGIASIARLCQYYKLPISETDLELAFKNSEFWVEDICLPILDAFSGIINFKLETIEDLNTYDPEVVLHQFINPYNVEMRKNRQKGKNPSTPITGFKDKRFDEIIIEFEKETLADIRNNSAQQNKAFIKAIHTYIPKGFPLLWVTHNQLDPDSKSKSSPVIRLIVGFSNEDKQNPTILYTSAVGYKEEGRNKGLTDIYATPLDKAITITRGLFAFYPLEPVEAEEEAKEKESND